MGGHALEKYGVFTERKDTNEFLRIGKEIQEIVKSTIGFETAMVRCFYEKESHGDLDLLIKIPATVVAGGGININAFIQETFQPKAIYHNSNVDSFDYQGFQIDFISIQEDGWEIANTYFSFDPLGNIMGKTYHKFNLSYGWDGLFYKFRNFNGRNSSDILISKDPRKIFEFCDYDYDRYLLGFSSISDIYDFVMESKYFDTGIFQFGDLNHVDRKRNKKRKSYNEFLEFMNVNNIGTKYTFNKDKDSYIKLIDSAFPESNLEEILTIKINEDRFNKALAEKFNGSLVMEWLPELKGKELGAALKNYKDSHGDGYENYILYSDIEKIKRNFLSLYNGNDLLFNEK